MMNMEVAIGSLALTTLLFGTSRTADAHGSQWQSAVYQTQYRTGFQRGYQDGYGRSH